MSYKIYDGHRVLVTKLGDTIERIREITTPLLIEQYLAEAPEDEKATARQVRNNIVEAAKSPHIATLMDVTCGIKFWLIGRYAYFVPFGALAGNTSVGRKLQEIDLPDVEEYGYWNNTDRPEEISAQAWRARYAVWNKAFSTTKLEAYVVDGRTEIAAIDFAFKVSDTLEKDTP